MITLFLTFLVLLILGPIFITGWYIVTRGYYDIEPNGAFVKRGKILKDWSIFWEDIDHYKPMYFFGQQLEKKLEDIKRLCPSLKTRFSMNQGDASLLCPAPLSEEEETVVQKAILSSLLIKGNDVFVYIERPVYRFPEWVRMITSSCLPCMSSVYGSLFWWVSYFVSVYLFKFDMNFAGWLVLWPFYVMSVAAINYFIDKKL